MQKRKLEGQGMAWNQIREKKMIKCFEKYMTAPLY